MFLLKNLVYKELKFVLTKDTQYLTLMCELWVHIVGIFEKINAVMITQTCYGTHSCSLVPIAGTNFLVPYHSCLVTATHLTHWPLGDLT